MRNRHDAVCLETRRPESVGEPHRREGHCRDRIFLLGSNSNLRSSDSWVFRRTHNRRVRRTGMSTDTGVRRIRTAALIAFAVILGPGVVSAQESAQGGDTAKAVRELTGEIRSLRAAIERTSESQLQRQILGLYLSLQQNRVGQATARLDAVRRELEGLTNHDREL